MKMKEAIEKGLDFEIRGRKYTVIQDEIRPLDNPEYNMGAIWSLGNMEREVVII